MISKIEKAVHAVLARRHRLDEGHMDAVRAVATKYRLPFTDLDAAVVAEMRAARERERARAGAGPFSYAQVATPPARLAKVIPFPSITPTMRGSQ